MFRKPDDGNTHAYAASMARYLGLADFERELQQCLDSRHPDGTSVRVILILLACLVEAYVLIRKCPKSNHPEKDMFEARKEE